MALRRRQYERPLVGAGPGFRRLLLVAFGTAALIGLLLGIVWIIAGLLNFHVLR
jgi:hypothetical protein